MNALIDLTSNKTQDCGSAITYAESLLEHQADSIENIVVLAHGSGVRSLTQETDRHEKIISLMDRGVVFKASRACVNAQELQESDIIDSVELVPNGVGELIRLQSEGYNVAKIP